MNQTSVTQKTGLVGLEFKASPKQAPDPVSMAKEAIAQAAKFCTHMMGADSISTTLNQLRLGNSTANGYFSYGLAKQVADYLSAYDDDIQAVYMYDHDATPEDSCFGDAAGMQLVHLIVWSKRKTAAFASLVAALDRALIEEFASFAGVRPKAHMLDVQIIDDEDVNNRVGYGASLSSLNYRPIEVWKR